MVLPCHILVTLEKSHQQLALNTGKDVKLMKKKILTALISMAVLFGAVPAVPVVADPVTTHTVTFVIGDHYEVTGEGITSNGDGTYQMTVEDGATIKWPVTPEPDAETMYSNIDKNLGFWGWLTKPVEDVSTYEEFNDSIFYFSDNTGGFEPTKVTGDLTLYAWYVGAIQEKVYDLSTSTDHKGGLVTFENIKQDPTTITPSNGKGAPFPYESEVSFIASPDEGYSFVGWSTSKSRDDVFTTSTTYNFVCETGNFSYYALFEKTHDVTVTVHFGTIENPDVIETLQMTVESGTTLDEIYTRADCSAMIIDFETDNSGCEFMTTAKALNEYSSYEETYNSIDFGGSISEDMDVYYTALLPVDDTAVTVTAPEAGTTSATAPAVSIGSATTYKLGQPEWVVSKDDLSPFSGTFEAEKSYYAWVALGPAVGYFFSGASDTVVTGGTVVDSAVDLYNIGLCVEVTVPKAAEEPAAEPAAEPASEPVAAPADISCVSGEGQEIVPASDKAGEFRFSDGGDDSQTFENAEYWAVDGVTVPLIMQDPVTGVDVVASKKVPGSVIITLYPVYLNTLSAGEHTLTVYFKNGETASAKFTIVAEAETTTTATPTPAASVPATGEEISSTMIWGAVLVSLAVISAGVVLDKKRLGKKDVK